jgi:hypothetical protein
MAPKKNAVVDNTTIVLEFAPIKKEDSGFGGFVDQKGVLYVPVFDRRTGELTRYDSELRNIRVSWYPNSGKYFVRNSLHVYRNGNNYSDFCLSGIRDSLEMLSDDLSVNIFEGRVHHLEYGCNIRVENPERLSRALVSYKSKNFCPMLYRGKTYGSACYFTEHRIKGYDKTLETSMNEGKQLGSNIFRWEVSVTAMRHLTNRAESVPIFTAKDLVNEDILLNLSIDLITKFNNTMKAQSINLSELTAHQIRVLATMRDEEVREHFKKNHHEAYKKDMRALKKIEAITGNEYYKSVGNSLAEKSLELITS